MSSLPIGAMGGSAGFGAGSGSVPSAGIEPGCFLFPIFLWPFIIPWSPIGMPPICIPSRPICIRAPPIWLSLLMPGSAAGAVAGEAEPAMAGVLPPGMLLMPSPAGRPFF
jgi:hypothetical protein